MRFWWGTLTLVWVLFGWALLRPETWSWGFHAAAYLPLGGLVWIASVVLGLALTRFHIPWKRVATPVHAGIVGTLMVASFFAYYHLNIKTIVYGDGRPMLEWYGDNAVFDPAWITDVFKPALFSAKESLTVGLHRVIAHVFHLEIREAYRIVSAVSGALSVGLWVVLLRRSRDLAPSAPVFLVAALFSSYQQLFFGHIENYPFAVLCATAFCAVAFGVFEGRIPWWWLIALWLVCLRAHAVYITLAPALLVAAAWSLRGRFPASERLVTWKGVIGLLWAPGLVVGALLYVFYFGSHVEPYWSPGRQIQASFLALVAPDPPLRPYTLVSGMHFLDFLNVLGVVGVPAVFLILGKSLGGAGWTQPRVLFFATALFFPLCFFFALNPALSMPRDWDLYGLLGPLLLFFAAALFGSSPAADIRGPLGVVTACAVFVAAGFWLHARPEPLSHRLEAAGRHVYRTYHVGSSHIMHMALKTEEDGEEQLARRLACLQSLDPGPGVDEEYAFLAKTTADYAGLVGKPEVAASVFEKALVHTETRRVVRHSLLQLYNRQLRRPEKSFPHVEALLGENDTNLLALKQGMFAALLGDDRDRFRRWMTRARALAPEDASLDALQDEADRRGWIRAPTSGDD